MRTARRALATTPRRAAGWAAAALFAPSSTLLVALLTAFLGGSILLNVFRKELPFGRRSSYQWFLVGPVLYAGLLALVTAPGTAAGSQLPRTSRPSV